MLYKEKNRRLGRSLAIGGVRALARKQENMSSNLEHRQDGRGIHMPPVNLVVKGGDRQIPRHLIMNYRLQLGQLLGPLFPTSQGCTSSS